MLLRLKNYPTEVRDKAVRMTLDRLASYPSMAAACRDMAPKLNVGMETLRKWIMQALADAGERVGPTTVELDEIKRLKPENNYPRDVNDPGAVPPSRCGGSSVPSDDVSEMQFITADEARIKLVNAIDAVVHTVFVHTGQVDTKTARALIATLKQTAQPITHPAAPAQWRIDRDRFIDLLDPSGDQTEFDNDQIRQLVQFLGDSLPTAASRHTTAEWHTQVDAATTRLLSLLS